jgi:hypothetical protein
MNNEARQSVFMARRYCYQMPTVFVALIMLGAATGYASELFGPVLGFTSAERGVY